MVPDIHINYFAIIICVVVSMPLGFLWFGPWFGLSWAKEMGLQEKPEPTPREMIKPLGLYALGSLLIAFVLAHSIEIWRPSTWNAGVDSPDWVYGLNAAFWTWLGFFIPLQLGRVAWEFRRWKLVFINSTFDFTRLLIFGLILAYWK
ncbi:MAG: DUF1761 domain-containing protein [Nitrospinae bacterium]|nr:DUF1761 domain-containing protein [Nitrospinota bacterium]